MKKRNNAIERFYLNPSRAFVVEMGEDLQAREPSINAIPIKVNPQ